MNVNLHDERHCSLQDEQPLPACEAHRIVHTMKDTGGNEAREGCGKHVACVKDSNAGGDLFPIVEHGKDVYCAWVVRSLRDTQEETSKKKADEILGKSSEGANGRPQHHHDSLHSR